MISTDEGMKMDESEKQDSNALSPIRETRQPSSNRTVETVLHP
jgi:hypothetical protein